MKKKLSQNISNNSIRGRESSDNNECTPRGWSQGMALAYSPVIGIWGVTSKIVWKYRCKIWATKCSLITSGHQKWDEKIIISHPTNCSCCIG